MMGSWSVTLWFDKLFEKITNKNRERRIEDLRRKRLIQENKSALDEQFESTQKNIKSLETKLDKTIKSIKVSPNDAA